MRAVIFRAFAEIEQTSFGEYRYEGEIKDGPPARLKSCRPLPFLDGDATYHAWCEGTSEDVYLNVLGFSRISFPPERDIRKAVLSRTLATVKNGQRRMGKCLTASTERDCSYQVFTEFGKDVRDAYVRNVRRSLGGATDVSQAFMKGILVCVGVPDSEIAKILHSLHEPEQERWFLPIGAPAGQEEVLENFFDLVASTRKNTALVAQRVDAMIKADPPAFFSCKTRPMAAREFGNLHARVYETYCRNTLGISTGEERLVDLSHGAADPFVVQEARNSREELVERKIAIPVGDFLMRRCFVAAMVTVMKFNQKKALKITEEDGSPMTDMRDAFENDCGSRGALSEVHVFCAEKKIMLKFDEKGNGNVEKQRLLFLNGKRTTTATLVLRDAQVLDCDTFTHLFWKMSKRIKFQGLNLTYRADWDASFRSQLWTFLKKKYEPVAMKRPETTFSENAREGTDEETHLCVVPTAIAATAMEDPERDDWVFGVSDMIFGKIADKKNGVAVVKTPTGLKKTVRAGDLFKCKINGRGAPLVPLSALLCVARKTKRAVWPAATVVVPSNLEPDEIEQTKAVVAKIAAKVYFHVPKHAHTLKTDERVDKVLEALVIP